MKYIRTKDGEIGIFRKAGDRNNNNEDYIAFKTFACSIKYLEEYDKDYKQADTIEELCDEFVLCEDNHYCIVGDIEAKEMAAANYGTIYGAVWMEKGLICVAKMNDKGELELL